MTKTMTDTPSADIPLKEYYVYVLMDPKDDSVFYIGKGTGKRAEAHMREARKSDSDETRKLEKIREIESREGTNNELKIRVIARFDSEAEAYAVESVLMHWMYDFEHLTNIQHGHGYQYVRRQGDFAIINGLDLNRVVNLGGNRKTGYLQDLVDRIARHNVLDSADELRGKLLEHIENISISEAMIWERGRWVALLININPNVNLALQFSPTGNNQITFNLVPADEGLNSRNLFSEIMKENGLEPKNGGRYAKLKTWQGSIDVNDSDRIIERIQEAFECFTGGDYLKS